MSVPVARRPLYQATERFLIITRARHRDDPAHRRVGRSKTALATRPTRFYGARNVNAFTLLHRETGRN